MRPTEYIVNCLRWDATHWFSRMKVGTNGGVAVCTEQVDRHNDLIVLCLFMMDGDDEDVIWITDYAETYDDLTVCGLADGKEDERAANHIYKHVQTYEIWPAHTPFVDDSPLEPANAIYMRVMPEMLNAGIETMSSLISEISNSFNPTQP